MIFGATDFWLNVATVAGVNLALSGDNAVVIALVAHSLPLVHRKKAIAFGVAAAIGFRLALTMFALRILALPYLKLLGALLLLWIAARLSTSVQKLDHAAARVGTLPSAIRTILMADVVMSLDNVLAVAAAAKDSLVLLALGLAASIPLLAWGSGTITRWMDRYPVAVVIASALIGYVAGAMALTDSAISSRVVDIRPQWLYLVPAACALSVALIGRLLNPRGSRRTMATHSITPHTAEAGRTERRWNR